MVSSDNQDGGKQATQHLLEIGHQRIGIINGPPIGAIAGLQERLDGHQQALSEAGLSFDPSLMVFGDYTRHSGELAIQQLLALPDPPTDYFFFERPHGHGSNSSLTDGRATGSRRCSRGRL